MDQTPSTTIARTLDGIPRQGELYRMLEMILRRLTLGAALVFAVVTITFLLINLAPGDPARLWVGPGAGQEELEAARRALGLDRPLPARYASWLADFVRGDWGTSLTQGRPVTRVILDAVPYTLLLSGTSLAITYLGGLVIGTIQAIRHRTRTDVALTVSTLFAYGMPAFWLATMLVLTFVYGAARFDWPAAFRFPALGAHSLDAEFLSLTGRILDLARHLALPLATLAVIGVAGAARFVRGAVLDARHQPYVRAARARGLRAGAVEARYVLRNALMPIITLLGLSLPALFSGTVFVEVIFAWPGMGREIVNAVASRDYPLVMATTTIFAVLVVLGNLLADLLYAVADPRLRIQRP